MQHQPSPTTRRDGWTAQRQLRFLHTLARTGSVTRAAAAAGLSRKSAYRLRARADGLLFAALWDRALQAPPRIAKVTLQGDSAPRSAGEMLENPPKDTKWRKYRNPRFDPFAAMVRDLREQRVPGSVIGDT